MNTCVFCLETGDNENILLHNVKCRCNFCFHFSCYELYNKKTVCPICRETVGELYTVEEEDVPPQPNSINISETVVITNTDSNIRRKYMMTAIFFGLIIVILIIVIRCFT
jgi:hypothetical protein